MRNPRSSCHRCWIVKRRFRLEPSDQFPRLCRAAVVGNQHLKITPGLAAQSVQRLFQGPRIVVRADDDRDFHSILRAPNSGLSASWHSTCVPTLAHRWRNHTFVLPSGARPSPPPESCLRQGGRPPAGFLLPVRLRVRGELLNSNRVGKFPGPTRGRSSVGRALASQAGCRGFESLRPLLLKAFRGNMLREDFSFLAGTILQKVFGWLSAGTICDSYPCLAFRCPDGSLTLEE